MPLITIQYGSETIRTSADADALIGDVILGSGVLYDRPCAGRGVCGKCAVQITGGLSAPTDAEIKHLGPDGLKSGLRLACQARIQDDVSVTVSAQAIHTDKIFEPEHDLRDLKGPLGLAIDLGSTTVGAFLVTLDDGRVDAGYAVLNYQTTVGAEIISRLLKGHQDPEYLSRLAIESIREAIEGLHLPAQLTARIDKIVIVGNTAMHHLLLKLPVEQLMRSPFEPGFIGVSEAGAEILGRGFGSRVRVFFPRVIRGFVGSDALACLVYFGFEAATVPGAALDLGTNGEVMITDGKRIIVASTAAGPAFEGVNIKCGMRALPGAITQMQIDERGEFIFETIGKVRPRGIAGSGLLSIVQKLRESGLIGENGRIIRYHVGLKKLIEETNEGLQIRLTRDVYLSQSDVRELQKAKAAIRAATEVLLQRAGLRSSDLKRVILTGSFGGRIGVKDTLSLGVIPGVSAGRVQSISNGAGLGAAMMLNGETFERATALADRVEHVELNADPEFMELYIANMKLAP